jgi:hypothetical protein
MKKKLRPDCRAGAIFEFAAMLTSLKEPETFSGKHSASRAAELAEAFCQSRGWGVSKRWTNKGRRK